MPQLTISACARGKKTLSRQAIKGLTFSWNFGNFTLANSPSCFISSGISGLSNVFVKFTSVWHTPYKREPSLAWNAKKVLKVIKTGKSHPKKRLFRSNAHHFQTSSTRRIALKPNQTMLVFGDDEKNRKNSSKPTEAMQKTKKLVYFL